MEHIGVQPHNRILHYTYTGYYRQLSNRTSALQPHTTRQDSSKINCPSAPHRTQPRPAGRLLQLPEPETLAADVQYCSPAVYCTGRHSPDLSRPVTPATRSTGATRRPLPLTARHGSSSSARGGINRSDYPPRCRAITSPCHAGIGLPPPPPPSGSGLFSAARRPRRCREKKRSSVQCRRCGSRPGRSGHVILDSWARRGRALLQSRLPPVLSWLAGQWQRQPARAPP